MSAEARLRAANERLKNLKQASEHLSSAARLLRQADCLVEAAYADRLHNGTEDDIGEITQLLPGLEYDARQERGVERKHENHEHERGL